MISKIYSLLLLFSISMYTFGQIGINAANPKATLDIYSKPGSSVPAGVIAPRITGDNLAIEDPNYGTDQNGAIVYVTQAVTVGTIKTSNINKEGYYYYNNVSGKWEAMAGSPEPWFSKQTNTGSTQNNENIYQQGQVGIGSSTIDTNAQLDITSSTKGLLIPRMSTVERDAIPAVLANGLLIYNITTNCFNYYDNVKTRWLNLCGGADPAKFDLFSCTAPTGPNSAYVFKQGTSLNSNPLATYTVVINVTAPGDYTIKASTVNGYSFSKSGTFNATGQFTVVLEGAGTPINHTEGAIPDNAISLEFNGIAVTPSCTMPTIFVASSGANIININCTSGITYGAGTYVTAQSTYNTAQHYIDVALTISGSGNILLETDTQNGLKFSSGSVAVTPSTTSIRMFAQGTIGATVGVVNFTLQNITPNCSGNISRNITTSSGGFTNPASKCLDLLNAGTTTDGYYWIKDASGNKYKTYCDMSNGGWTLVKSLSERQILVVEKTQAESISTQSARNVVNTETGIFNEYAFSLPASVLSSISTSSTAKAVRIIMKQGGSTGTTQAAIESSTIAPINDTWAKENYWNITILSGNPYTADFISGTANNTNEGKIFNTPFGKASNANNIHQFGGVNFAFTPPGFYSSANFFTGFYGANGYVAGLLPANNVTYNYTAPNSGTYTYNKYYINDLFGLYMNLEPQLNHHIGTCSNSTDDFGGASFCAANWANWRAHNFNLKSGNYEGRLLQYYIK